MPASILLKLLYSLMCIYSLQHWRRIEDLLFSMANSSLRTPWEHKCKTDSRRQDRGLAEYPQGLLSLSLACLSIMQLFFGPQKRRWECQVTFRAPKENRGGAKAVSYLLYTKTIAAQPLTHNDAYWPRIIAKWIFVEKRNPRGALEKNFRSVEYNKIWIFSLARQSQNDKNTCFNSRGVSIRLFLGWRAIGIQVPARKFIPSTGEISENAAHCFYSTRNGTVCGWRGCLAHD